MKSTFRRRWDPAAGGLVTGFTLVVTITRHDEPGLRALLTIREILQNAQRIVGSGEGDFETSNECEYCDDYHANKGPPED